MKNPHIVYISNQIGILKRNVQHREDMKIEFTSL